ncbi:MAG: hypothetical protein AB1646_05575 [Thermodesulfobacteriota bacterium]
MGIFDRIFGAPHPSDSWKPSPGVALVLDLERHALCDVRIGDPVEWLAFLGPPQDRKALKDGGYTYPSRGLEIWADDGIVKDLVVRWIDEVSTSHFEPFPGECRFRGRPIVLNSGTQEGDFVKFFGAPYWRDVDDMEILLFYEFPAEIEWQVEFTLGGGLKGMMITTPPLLSQEDQRQAYGVSKRRPP